MVDDIEFSGGSTESHSTPTDGVCLNQYTESNTSPQERAKMLSEYLQSISSVCQDPLLMPLRPEGKSPAIKGKCSLDSKQAKQLLVPGDEAIRSISEGGSRGFCLYAGKASHGTEQLVFTDHDDPSLWSPTSLPQTLLAVSGSGQRYHQTFINSGDVVNAKATGELKGAGEVRAHNWYIVLPGSIHPSGGVYYVLDSVPPAVLHKQDLPPELQGSTHHQHQAVRVEPSQINTLPTGYEPDSVKSELGYTLGETRLVSKKLDVLLKDLNPGYPSPSEADMAAVSLLLYWRFEERDIANIIRGCRPRKKLQSHPEYLDRLILSTVHTQLSPICVNLGKAVIGNAIDNGGRPIASVETLILVRSAILVFGGEADTMRMARILGDDLTEGAAQQRVLRAMRVYEDAGLVTYKKEGRKTVFVDEGLEGISLPGDI